MSPTNISSDRVHDFNLKTLALDKELGAEFEIDLLLMPEELRANSIVAAQWHTAGDRQVCFPKNTKIETITGKRNIQELKKGDLVQSHLGWKKIKETMKRRYSGKMVRIETSDGRYLVATRNHPIFEIKRGWIEIGKLRKIDRLKTCEDKIVDVISIQDSICQEFDVHNLEVENVHTYYANGILVHNCPLCASLDGNIFPVDSGEWGRIFPPIHLQCFLSSRILIDTLNGWKKIGDIAVGDQVLTHRGRFRRVSRLFRSCNYRGKVITVIMDGSYEKFIVTPEHPFLTEGGWKKSSELRNSDKVLSLSTKSKPDNYEFVPWKIKSVKSHLLSRRKKLFNFAVEEDESYIANGLVSHNCRCMLSYITSQERGVEARIREYRPIDPELLKKWSSKIYTKAEIAEIAKHHKEFIPEEELEI